MFVKQNVSGLVEAMPSIDEIVIRLPALLKKTQLCDALEIAIQTSL